MAEDDYWSPRDSGGLLGGGGGWLGNLLNFSGGRSTTADLYGDLFSKKQLAAIQQRESQAKFKGLLDVLNQAAAPSEFKKNYGQILGQAGSAMLGSAATGDAAAESALKGGLTAQKIAQLKQELALDQQYQQIMRDIRAKRAAAGGGMPGAAPAPPPGAPPGAPPPGPTPGAPVPNPAGNGPPPPQGTFGLPGSAPRAQPSWGLPPALPPDAQHTGLPAGLDPNQQFAGLLGGGAQPPFPTEEAALRPPDTFIPSGPGGLLNPEAVRTVGAGADDQWLALNAPFPTRADPAGAPIKWRHDRPVIDPNDPASQGPGSPAGPGPGGLLAQRPGLKGSAWEAANNNLGGMRIPGVNKTPSQGGFQSFATPEAGLRAISHQLDRYASGATTGKPLTTIRQIVSTWAPAHENPTAKLIERATRIVGVDPNTPLDLSDPLTKAKLITAMIAIEQGGRVPVDPELIASVASAPPGSVSGLDEVVGQRRSVPGFTRAQYGGGGPGGAPGAPAAAGGGSDQPIPGIGLSPQDLGLLDAFATMAKRGSPFKSLLDTYYKDPAYLGQAAAAQAGAQQPFQLEQIRERADLDLKNTLAGKGWRMTPSGGLESIPGHPELEGKSARQLEEIKTQATKDIEEHKQKYTFSDVRVVGPDGAETTRPMSNYDKSRLLDQQRAREAEDRKNGVFGGKRAGDIVDTPYVSPEEQTARTESAKAGAGKSWDTMTGAIERAQGAQTRIQLYGQIAESMKGFQPGAGAELRLRSKQLLKAAGVIDDEGVSDGEAMLRATRTLQAIAAEKSKGSTSDYERGLIAEGAAQMSNSPEGLAKLIAIGQRLDEYEVKVAEIHQQVAAEKGRPDLLEAQKRISMLGPPISAGERAALEQIRSGGVPRPSASAPPNELGVLREEVANAMAKNVPRAEIERRLREKGFDPAAVFGGQ